jgi:hypothetical protein
LVNRRIVVHHFRYFDLGIANMSTLIRLFVYGVLGGGMLVVLWPIDMPLIVLQSALIIILVLCLVSPLEAKRS